MKTILTLCMAVLLLSCGKDYDEVKGPWKLIKKAVPVNVKFDCGDDKEFYKNNTQTGKNVSYTITNNCEFSAYVYIYGEDDTYIRSETIPGRSTHAGSAGIPKGGSIDLVCTLVSTVENLGCKVSYTVVGTK
ncbi:hypothetical protein BFR04_12070 [Gaetbulibacter sp. 4G1]|nr:hypothetical protein [Gaetbulibacter sp. 4G1]PIA82033.1 hypothetical protein BFR04_12070 [Gaetbulibacter sp. 4G1]